MAVGGAAGAAVGDGRCAQEGRSTGSERGGGKNETERGPGQGLWAGQRGHGACSARLRSEA
jgi:hypothetical protein